MKRWLWIGGVAAVAAAAVLGWRATHALPGVWSTDSPQVQNGLRLIAVRQAKPAGWGGGVIDNFDGFISQYAWFEATGDASLPKNAAIRFRMVDGSGNEADLWDAGYLGGDRIRQAARIPLCYGPEFIGSTLEAWVGQERIGAWKLSGLPRLSKRISDEENDVLIAEALGYRFTAETPFKAYYLESRGRRTGWSLCANAKIAATGTDDGKDRMEVLASATRTTWGGDSSGHSITDPRTRNKAGVVIGLPFTSCTKRAELTLVVRRYRVYDEPISFKNVQMKGDGPADQPGECTYTVTQSQSVTTPSGLTMTLEANPHPWSPHGTVRLTVTGSKPPSSLELDDSPLCRSTGKRVAVEIVPLMGKLESWSNAPRKPANWNLSVPAPAGPIRKSFTLPEIKLLVRQKAVLEEKTVKLIAPVEQQLWKPYRPSR